MLATLIVGGVLALAGFVKLLRPQPAARALAAAGRTGRWGQPAALRALGALEVCIGLGVLAFAGPLVIGAAVLLWGFAAWLWLEVARGRSGDPCPCFGARTAIGPRSASGTLALALLATALACVGVNGGSELSAIDWLVLACGLLACAGLALGWIAFLLAREVAGLRGQLAQSAPRGALEIPEEGPPVGEESPLIERFADGEGEVVLAVFLSPGCSVCRELEPSLALFATRGATELVVFDEQREQLAWHTASVPGSPYAVAMNRQGQVLAKGTFNTLEQLASIPATALLRLEQGFARV